MCDHESTIPPEELRSLNKGTQLKPKNLAQALEQKKHAEERADSKKKPRPSRKPESEASTAPDTPRKPDPKKVPARPAAAAPTAPDTPRKAFSVADIRSQLEQLEKGKRSTRSLTKANRAVCDDSPYGSRCVGFKSNVTFQEHIASVSHCIN